MYHVNSCKCKVYAYLAVTCHLHFWQNDPDLVRATAVTRGWNGYQNKSQHRKSTLEKKIFLPFLQGFELVTFQSWVRRSNHWAIPWSALSQDWTWAQHSAKYCISSVSDYAVLLFSVPLPLTFEFLWPIDEPDKVRWLPLVMSRLVWGWELSLLACKHQWLKKGYELWIYAVCWYQFLVYYS